MELERVLSILQRQESVFIRDTLTNMDCLRIGYHIAQEVEQSDRPVAIRIYKAGILVFSWTMEGKEESHFGWIEKKIALGKAADMSSFQAKIRHHLFHEMKRWDEREEFAFGAGAFPIRSRTGDVLAWIGISGLKEPEDHDVIVEALEKWSQQSAPRIPGALKEQIWKEIN